MPASPRRRERCNRHDARPGIVALIPCCLIRLSNGCLGPPVEIVSLPACTQRSIRRVATLASRLDPLAFSGDKRGRSKALFFAVPDGTGILDPEPFKFSCGPEKGLRTSHIRVGRKRLHLRSHQLSPLVLQLYHCSTGFPHEWRTIFFFATLRTPTRLVTTSSFCAVTQRKRRVCVRRTPRCKLSCILPSSSWIPD